jgi:hypothetical protein
MGKHPLLSDMQMVPFRQRFGDKKIFAQCLMPIRGPKGFRKLDYDFASTLDPKQIIDKIQESGFNAFALVVKDTDGACLANTSLSWNPTGRDLTAEFSDLCQKRNMIFMLSFTNMNDAYRGATHPETVSVHIKDGKDHKAGDSGTHKEGEMRVDLPEGVSFEEMKKRIPFLTEQQEIVAGKARSQRGTGYIPLTSFHCPRSEHTDYLLDLIKELVSKYHIDGILADYIRYHHGYTDLCGCPRCRQAFAEKYPQKAEKVMKCKEWWRFRMDNVIAYGKRFNDSVKSVDPNIVTAWFNLPGPKIYSERLVAQDYRGLTAVMDAVIPMTYPYLTGTIDDGKKWGMLGNLMHWYSQGNMMRRFKDYGENGCIYCVTNSVECNPEEMLKSCIGYDYGLGIALFKYFGTSDAQWEACKLYSKILEKQPLGAPPPTVADIRSVLREVYKNHPPKVPPKWYLKEQQMVDSTG